jgi:16S rRNA (cytidine1402-2'-O)-methyltransferase
MSGTLFVVATPIGNLEDITLRALRVLRSVAVIAAEDTRRTARLLAHHGITTRTISFHEHNTRLRLPQLLSRLQKGEDVAVVSDAGTPGMSDPGVELVQACLAHGIAVDPVPGASAALTALVASGFATDEVTILGFPPSRGNGRKSWIERAVTVPHTTVLFESPHRISSLLTAIQHSSVDRPIMVGRELTKLHQEFLRGTTASISSQLKEVRGEFTIVLGPIEVPVHSHDAPSGEVLHAEFCHLTESGGLSRREAVVQLAKRYGLRPKQVYAMLEAAKVLANDLP